MTTHLRLAVFALAACAVPSHAASPAASPEDQAVLAPVRALFAGMAHRDAAAIRAPLLPGGSLTLMRDGQPVQMSFDDFAARVARPAPQRIEERIHHPLVRIDHDLAVVWAPFDFLSDGKVDHCGTDLFTLVRVKGEWRIASIADTGRKACTPH